VEGVQSRKQSELQEVAPERSPGGIEKTTTPRQPSVGLIRQTMRIQYVPLLGISSSDEGRTRVWGKALRECGGMLWTLFLHPWSHGSASKGFVSEGKDRTRRKPEQVVRLGSGRCTSTQEIQNSRRPLQDRNIFRLRSTYEPGGSLARRIPAQNPRAHSCSRMAVEVHQRRACVAGGATMRVPVPVRPRVSGRYIISASTGGCTNSPSVVARATYVYVCSPRCR